MDKQSLLDRVAKMKAELEQLKLQFNSELAFRQGKISALEDLIASLESEETSKEPDGNPHKDEALS